MDLTHQLLSPVFERIGDILAAQPGQLAQFETWANAQSLRLKGAADRGMTTLAYEAEMLREQLKVLQQPASPMQFCQQIWLTGLIDFVEDLLKEATPDDVPWQESHRSADNHL